MRLAYLGPAGTYTEAAALAYDADAELVPVRTFTAGAQAADLTVSISGAQVAAFHLSGVDQARLAPETGSASGGSGSVSGDLTTGSDGTVVVSAFGLATSGFDPWSPSGVEEVEVAYRDQVFGAAVGASYELAAGAGTVTLGWSGGGTGALLVLASYGLVDPPGGGGSGGAEHYAYGPFGEGSEAGNGTIAYRYAGHRFDPETGLYYMRARYYSPATGRFLSPDPIGYDDGPNIYAYVYNDPINFIDPLGLEALVGMPRINIDPLAAKKRDIALAIALTAMSVVPFAGEGMDGYVAVDPFGQYSPAEQSLALASLGVNAATGGTAPNAGALIIAGSKVLGKHADDVVKEIPVSTAKYGEGADHIADAQKAGQPDVVTIARPDARDNRKASIGHLPKVPGKHLDEYPPAMFKEGGAGASVRPISPKDNMGAGACIGNACRGLANGVKVRIKVVE